MAFKCSNLIVVAVLAAHCIVPAYMQFNSWLGETGNTDGIVMGIERSLESLRRNLADLNSTANNGESLAEEKVRDWYLLGLSRSWRWEVNYAQWLNPDVTSCPEDPVVDRLLKEVEVEALACVRDKVPRGIPEIHASIDQVLVNMAEFLQRVRKQAEECEEMTGFQGAMCKATKLAPLAGQVGMFGGEVGRVGGQIAVLVDGNARHCTAMAAQSRGAQALAASHTTAECIKAAGGNHGNADQSRTFLNQKRNNINGINNVVIVNGVRYV